ASLTTRWGAGRSSLSSRALEPPGSLCTFPRCSAGLAQDCHACLFKMKRGEGFPEFIPSTARVTPRRHLYKDESPALTAVLQAQPGAIVPGTVHSALHAKCYHSSIRPDPETE